MKLDTRNRPIPRRPHSPTALDYKNVPVDLSDSRSAEPLVDVTEWGIAAQGYYARTDGLNAPYHRSLAAAFEHVFCRRSVAERLRTANERLLPLGVELFLLDGYRSLALQKELWAFYIEKGRESLDDPTESNCIAFAGEYCSDPREFDESDSHTWPTHMTGGAVDLTLRIRHTGEFLFMGSVFDDPAEISHTAYFEKLIAEHASKMSRLPLSYTEALGNRRLLFWAMIEGGFANYPYEWWHFDWGTQFWVTNGSGSPEGSVRQNCAWYGPAKLAR
ncbi:MAG: M15 family metallopeptidase [Candidatus Binatia bacterium]